MPLVPLWNVIKLLAINFQVVCLEEDTQRMIQCVSPIHPDTFEAEIANLKQGSYIVYLEVHVSAKKIFITSFHVQSLTERIVSDFVTKNQI